MDRKFENGYIMCKKDNYPDNGIFICFESPEELICTYEAVCEQLLNFEDFLYDDNVFEKQKAVYNCIYDKVAFLKDMAVIMRGALERIGYIRVAMDFPRRKGNAILHKEDSED